MPLAVACRGFAHIWGSVETSERAHLRAIMRSAGTPEMGLGVARQQLRRLMALARCGTAAS